MFSRNLVSLAIQSAKPKYHKYHLFTYNAFTICSALYPFLSLFFCFSSISTWNKSLSFFHKFSNWYTSFEIVKIYTSYKYSLELQILNKISCFNERNYPFEMLRSIKWENWPCIVIRELINMRAFYPVEFKLQRVWASARARATGLYSLIYIKLSGLLLLVGLMYHQAGLQGDRTNKWASAIVHFTLWPRSELLYSQADFVNLEQKIRRLCREALLPNIFKRLVSYKGQTKVNYWAFPALSQISSITSAVLGFLTPRLENL